MNRLAPAARASVAAGIFGALVALLLLAFGARAIHVAPVPERSATTPSAVGPNVGLQALLGAGDGQAYEAIARDPSLARPQLLASKPEYAYRAQRPLFAETAWALSFGRPRQVPLALAVLAALSAGLAVAALGAVLARRNIPARFALGLFVIPAVTGIVWGMTPELLELALITFGVLAWTAKPKPRVVLAVVAFTLAALTRESMLLVPLTLALVELWSRRSSASIHKLRPLLIPFASYAAWIAVVRIRVGYWPFAARTNRLTLVPFSGLVHSIQHSSDRWTALAWIVAGLLVAVSALTLGRRDEWYAIAIAFLALAPFLGSEVWRRPADFGRVLLPVFVFSAMLVLDALWQRQHLASEAAGVISGEATKELSAVRRTT